MTARLQKSREAAEYLCISEKTLWNLTNTGQVRAVRMGRLVRYDSADLDEFVERSKTIIS